MQASSGRLSFINIAGKKTPHGATAVGALLPKVAISLLTFTLVNSLSAQQTSSPKRVGSGATSLNASANLPLERLGGEDLIGITVYDSPELTRTVRVESDGEIRLPMLHQHILAAGLYPGDLESAIQLALVNEHILVDPIVTVSVVEYRSRSIYVVGAVRTPVTFQAAGNTTLLDALSQAGGLTSEAGGEILVTQSKSSTDGHSPSQFQVIPVHGLLYDLDPALNLTLLGGEVIRVPEAGRVYVVGNVNKPGVFPITDGSDSSVLKVLALSGGLEHYAQHTAYVYRTINVKGPRKEIPIELKKIMDRKSPDVPLLADDILYVPEATGRKNTLTALNRIALVGVGLSADLLILYR